MRLVLCSCPPEAVDSFMRELVEKHLASCVNAVPGVKKTSRWKGELCVQEETLLLIQTPLEKLDELFELLVNLHPSELPEIIALGIFAGHRPYLEWAEGEVPKPSNQEEAPEDLYIQDDGLSF